MSRSNPSIIASSNGLVVEVPPPKRFHRVSANVSACESDVNPYDPAAPPRERRIFLPAA
jgi:hypothetical protein